MNGEELGELVDEAYKSGCPNPHGTNSLPRTSSFWGKAFTLLETMIVVGVITIIVAITTPALRKSREEGRRIACLSNIRQIGIAFQMYVNNNSEFPPVYDQILFLQHHYWDQALFGYMATNSYDVFGCPSHAEYNWNERDDGHSYGYNLDGLPNAYPPTLGSPVTRMSEATRLSRSMVVADSGGLSILPEIARDQLHRLAYAPASARVSNRHSGGANLLFGDSSAGWHIYSELHPSGQTAANNGESSDMFWFFKNP